MTNGSVLLILLAGCSNLPSDPANIIACGDRHFPAGVYVNSQCQIVPLIGVFK